MEIAQLSLWIAFAAGIFSFISPCVLPLLPSFISLIASQSLDDLKQTDTHGKIVFLKTLVFVLGFSLVFISLGLASSKIGYLLISHKSLLRYIGGTVIILLGFHTLSVIKFDFLNKQLSYSRKSLSVLTVFGLFITGAAFAAGWTPCIGPILASILILAANQENSSNGLYLLIFYSLGLAIPFILTSLFINKFLAFFSVIKKYFRAIEIITGLFLILIGILIMLNLLEKFNYFFV
ncbi:MAG: cytochrome c biogenesis protein CcdA [Elusimicrobiota bacterium]|jgi:cytochrome c-type biogenesis protein|nr:cytochrome c biogenesis protein CcdA [Elusimicrobiota bacterium]